MKNNEIPKIIHYCWFGGKPLPKLAVKCIASWKKYFPDYEIKEWNENNFDFSKCEYAREAYLNEKWAFVSDYARFYILYHEGGIYFDTDVEVIKSFSDIISCGSFMGVEKNIMGLKENENCIQTYGINPGLGLGGPARLPLYKEILELYEQQHFVNVDGALNVETVVVKTTNILLEKGYNPYKKCIQEIAGVMIYPPEYFCPMNYESGKIALTDNSRSIHHYNASWFSNADKIILKIGRVFVGKGHIAHILNRILDFPFRVWAKVEKLGIRNTVKFVLKKIVIKKVK